MLGLFNNTLFYMIYLDYIKFILYYKIIKYKCIDNVISI